MEIATSSDLVYNNFRKLDNCILACIWSILLFSIAILTGEYFLYNYLKPQLLQKELFLYLFSATILFYLIIILAAYYILSKVDDYKMQESSAINSTVKSEIHRLREDDFNNAYIFKMSHVKDALRETKSLSIEPQQTRTTQHLYPDPSLACVDICSQSSSSTMKRKAGEIDRNLLNTKKWYKKAFAENIKREKYCANMQKLVEHDTRLFIQNCTDACHWTKKTIQDTESLSCQNMFRTCAENHVPDVSESKRKLQEPATPGISNNRRANVDETSFMLLSNKPVNHSHNKNMISYSCRNQSNKMVIPEIIIEDVDRQIPTISHLPIYHSGESSTFHQFTAKKNLNTSEVDIRCIACFKCKTSSPIQMSYNTVGLPEPVKHFNQTKPHKNIINSRNYFKNQIFDDCRNQKHIQGSQIVKSYCEEESRGHALQIEKQRTNHMNYVNLTPEVFKY